MKYKRIYLVEGAAAPSFLLTRIHPGA